MSKIEVGDAVEIANQINTYGDEPGTVRGFWHDGDRLYVIIELLIPARLDNGCTTSVILAHIDNVKRIETND